VINWCIFWYSNYLPAILAKNPKYDRPTNRMNFDLKWFDLRLRFLSCMQTIYGFPRDNRTAGSIVKAIFLQCDWPFNLVHLHFISFIILLKLCWLCEKCVKHIAKRKTIGVQNVGAKRCKLIKLNQCVKKCSPSKPKSRSLCLNVIYELNIIVNCLS